MLPPAVPRRGNRVLRAAGRSGLTILGWSIEGDFPNEPKLVIIVAPHTSNWDFLVGLFAALAVDVDASWFGKHSLFRWPLRGLFRWFGGIPVVRGESHHVVGQWIAEFNRRDRIALGIAPEGTRRRVSAWRTGFWHLARGAHVPILPVALDYGRKMVSIGSAYWPTEDLEGDLERLRSFYRGMKAKHPSQFDAG